MKRFLKIVLLVGLLPAAALAQVNAGSYQVSGTAYFYVTTNSTSTGAAADADAVPAYRCYTAESGTPFATGTFAKLDDANTLGFYSEALSLATLNPGDTLACRITATVSSVDGHTVHIIQVAPPMNITHAAGTAWASGAITAASIATDAIGAAEIAADAIGASELATDAIGAAELAANAIGAAEVADDAIDVGAIATNAIGAAEIADAAVDAATLAADSVTAAKVAADVATELQVGVLTMPKGIAYPNFQFFMASSVDGSGLATATVTCKCQKDAGAGANCTNGGPGVPAPVTGMTGFFRMSSITSTEMNGNEIAVMCTATLARDAVFKIVTQH